MQILQFFNSIDTQVMVLNVSSLLKTVKAVEDEHTRGTRAMEATVEAISQEIRVNINFSYNNIENYIQR